MQKTLRKKSSEEIENDLLRKEFLEASDYDFRRNTISEEPNYTVFITISETKQYFEGICKIELILVENFTDLFLDFKGELQRIWVNKTLIYYNHETPDCSGLYNGSIIVISKDFLRPHLNNITIEYKGLPMSESRGLHREDSDGKEYFYYTLSEPNYTSLFMPIIGQLNVKGSFKLYVHHPVGFYAMSNNELKRRGSLKDDSFFEDLLERFEKVSKFMFWSKIRVKYFESDFVVSEFHSTGLLCFNMFAIAVGSFKKLETQIILDSRKLALGFYARASWIEELKKVLELFTAVISFGISFFENLTGKHFPYSKYDTLFVKEFHLDAIETPGLVIMYEEYVRFWTLDSVHQTSILKVILHEIAHMWYGNLVSINWWSDLWIKEGISEYMAFEALKHIKLPTMDKIQSESITKEIIPHVESVFALKVFESLDFELDTLIPLNPLVPDTHCLQMYYNPVPYEKGALMFSSLHKLVGDKTFRSVLRKITNFYSHHNISTSILYNLIRVCVRNVDEEELCMITEELFDKMWFDHVLLPFYSVIGVSRFEYLPSEKSVKVEFERREASLRFDRAIVDEYFSFDGQQQPLLPTPKKVLDCHSADEMFTKHVPLTQVITPSTILRRHNILRVTLIDQDGKVGFESWCRVNLAEDRQLSIPDLAFVPKAVLLNVHLDSYAICIPDEVSLGFLLTEEKIFELTEPMRVVIYLSITAQRHIDPSIESSLQTCLNKESAFVQKLLSHRIPVFN